MKNSKSILPFKTSNYRFTIRRLPDRGKAFDPDDEVITTVLSKAKCPSCYKIYDDRSLRFCRWDGTKLTKLT